MTHPDDAASAEPRPALVSAMTTQHFALQSAIGITTAEAGGRASIYMYSLSGALVAIGFADHSAHGFSSFIGAVLPAIFVLGLFTIIRLVDILLEHLQALIALARVLDWYRTLTSDRALQMAFEVNRSIDGTDVPALRLGPLAAGLTTVAAMIATVNAFVGAVGVVLMAERIGPLASYAWLLGTVTFAALVAVFFGYQTWRLREVLRKDERRPSPRM